jgi:phosphonate transport system substrate-binding protein
MSVHPGLRRFCFGLLTLVLLSPALTRAQDSYLVGVVPQFEARRLHQIWQPILDYLQQETGASFRLIGAPTIPAFEKEFAQGNFDFAYMNPYHLIMANNAQGYQPLVRDVGRQLYGVLVVSKQSGITRVQELEGKKIAFPAPNALGASLMMRQELVDDFGLNFTPRYVKTHDSVYLNVLLSETAAGGGVQKTLNQQKPQIRDNLTVIHQTRKVAPHPFASHPRVPPEVVEQVVKAFLKLGQSKDGKAMLAAIPMKQPGRARLADYANLEAMGLDRFHVTAQ